MQAFYYRGPEPNVGDDFNDPLWRALIPDMREIESVEWLVGVGTILDSYLHTLRGTKLVVGSGLRFQDRPLRLPRDTLVAAVRGPLTASALGLPERLAICDPGFFVRRLDREGPLPGRVGRVGVIPHVFTERWTRFSRTAQETGITVISPMLTVDRFMRELRACARVFTESLHGAIFADALRIPWARIHICSRFYEGKGVSDFKWTDTFAAVGEDRIAAVNPRGLLRTRKPGLMARPGVRRVEERLERQLSKWLVERQDDEALFRLSSDERLDGCLDALAKVVAEIAEDPLRAGVWAT